MKFPDTDFSIVEKLANEGDTDNWNFAWRKFFEIYHPLLNALARNCFAAYNFAGVQQSAVDDVVCDSVKALLDIFAKRRFKPGAHFRGLLKSVVRNRTVDYMRKNKRLITAREIGDIEMAQAAPSDDFDNMDKDEFLRYMRARIMDVWENLRHEISPQSATIFELVKIKGRTPKSVMDELGVSRSVVDNSVYKTMKKLKEKLAKIETEEM